MRHLLLLGLAAPLLAAATPARAVPLPFSGSMAFCQAVFYGTSCPGDPSLQLAWQVQGVAQLDGSLLSFEQPLPLQSQAFVGPGHLGGAFGIVHMMAALGILRSGSVDLVTQGVQGLGVELDDLEMRATSTVYWTSITRSGSATYIVIRTGISSLLFDSGSLGAGGSLPGQYSVLGHFTDTSSTQPIFGAGGPVTMTAPPWTQVAASVAAGGGTLQLVTPVRVAYGSPPGTAFGGAILVVDLVFIPEPATGLLAGLGAIGLGLLGRRRRLRRKFSS